MDVPDMMLNLEGIIPAGTMSEDALVGIHAASMFTPGALMSGCKYQQKTHNSCEYLQVNKVKSQQERQCFTQPKL